MAHRTFPQPPPAPRRYPLPPSMRRREEEEDPRSSSFDPERPPVVEARSHHFSVNQGGDLPPGFDGFDLFGEEGVEPAQGSTTRAAFRDMKRGDVVRVGKDVYLVTDAQGDYIIGVEKPNAKRKWFAWRQRDDVSVELFEGKGSWETTISGGAIRTEPVSAVRVVGRWEYVTRPRKGGGFEEVKEIVGPMARNPRASSGMSPRDFDPEQLRIGAQHELEHTDSIRSAERIAMDHLAERPDYYERLEECMPEHEPNAGRDRPYSAQLVERHLGYLENLYDRMRSSERTWQAWRDRDLESLIKMGAMTASEARVVASAEEYLAQHYDQWEEEQEDKRAEQRGWEEFLENPTPIEEYSYQTYKWNLLFTDDTLTKINSTDAGFKVWETGDYDELVRMGVLTNREADRLRYADEYLERYRRQWRTDQLDEDDAESVGFEDNPSSYYVWVLDDGDRPIEGPYGPYSKDTAKQYARISATQGRHDRAVSVGSSPDAEIIRIYEGGTGEKLVANAGSKTKSGDQIKLSDGRTMTLGKALDDGLVETLEWISHSRTKEDSRGKPLEIVRYVAREVGGDRLYWEIGKTLFESRTGRLVSIGR